MGVEVLVGFGFVGSGHPQGFKQVPVGVDVVVGVGVVVLVGLGVGVNG